MFLLRLIPDKIMEFKDDKIMELNFPAKTRNLFEDQLNIIQPNTNITPVPEIAKTSNYMNKNRI